MDWLSTNHNLVTIGGVTAAEEYQRREGKYADRGAVTEADLAAEPTLGPLAADAYQGRKGERYTRKNDLVEAAVSVPKGAPAEWADPKQFWAAAEAFERDRAQTRYAANQKRCDKWREDHPATSTSGGIAVVPADVAGNPEALEKWVADQTRRFHRSVTGKVLRESPLVCKVRLEAEGHDQKPTTLRFDARSRAEWMTAEADMAMRWHVAVDNRLSEADVIEYAEKIRARANAEGLYCSTGIHWDDEPGKENHHIHALTNLRPIDEDGNFASSRVIRTPQQWRERNRAFRQWAADTQNEMLRERGFEATIDPRSFAERGIDRQATQHEGIKGRPTSERPKTARAEANDRARRERFDRALADPSSLVREASDKKAIWSAEDLKRQIDGRDPEMAEAVDDIVSEALQAADVVALPIRSMTGEQLYATQGYLDREARTMAAADRLAKKTVAADWDPAITERILSEKFGYLSEPQVAGVRHAVSPAALTCVIGVAGSGKTTLSEAAAAIAQANGARVLAMAPTGAAADLLGAKLGVTGKTMQSYFELWDRLDDIDQMLETGKISNKERERIESRLADTKPIPPRVRAALERTLQSGELTAGRRAQLEADREGMAEYDLKEGDFIIADESGLAGAVVADRLLSRVEMRGTKIVFTGDPEQYSAISAGAPFRAFVDRYGAVSVDDVIRQGWDTLDCLMTRDDCSLDEAATTAASMAAAEIADVEAKWMAKAKDGKSWQQRATELYSKGDAAAATRMYMDAGRVVWTDTREEALDLAAATVAKDAATFGADQVISTVGTNADARQVNAVARDQIRDQVGVDSASITFKTEDREGKKIGDTTFYVGDRVSFLRNDNQGRKVPDHAETQSGRGVRNGTSGSVTAITDDGHLVVTLDKTAADPGGRQVVVDPAVYSAVAIGLCLTGERSQGATADASTTLMNERTDARSAYVTDSRHRVKTTIIADRETFAGEDDLLRQVDRGRHKAMAADYVLAAGERPYYEMVQRFAEADAEARALYNDIKAAAAETGGKVYEDPRWPKYEALKEGLKPAAEQIADNIDQCRRFVRMADLSVGAINIAAGRREKVMSAATEALREKVREYAAVVDAVRDLWNDIKATHPGPRARRHPDYANFERARDARDAMAAEIAKDPAHTKWTAAAGIGTKTVAKHAADHVERRVEEKRVSKLGSAGRDLHAAAQEYKEAYAEFRAELETVRGFGGDIRTAATTEAATADRWAAEVLAMAEDMADPDAAIAAEGIDPEQIYAGAERTAAAAAWARYDYLSRTGQTEAAEAVAAEILERTAAEKPEKEFTDGKFAADDHTDDPFEAPGVDSIPVDAQPAPESPAGMRDVFGGAVAPEGARAAVLLQSDASSELDGGKSDNLDVRWAGARRGRVTAPRPWTAAVVQAGCDWRQLQAAADRHAIRSAPIAVRDSVAALQTYFDARTAAQALAPERLADGMLGPPLPRSPAYEKALRDVDASAWAAMAKKSHIAGVAWWDGRRKYKIDVDKLQAAADRHAARLEIAAWQQVRAQGPAAAASMAAGILERVKSERAGEGRRPLSGAIRDAGGPWADLEKDARRHVVATSPDDTRPARAAALAYLDAVGAAKTATDKTAAWHAVDAAAADLVARSGWREAVEFWDAYRRDRFSEATLTAPSKIEKAAARHQARDLVEAWRSEGDLARRGELADAILSRAEAERKMDGEGAKPMIAAVAQAGGPWSELRASAEDAAIAQAGSMADTLRLARAWMCARAIAAKKQAEGGLLAGLTEDPSIKKNWEQADALASFARRPDAAAALDWWRERRGKAPTVEQAKAAEGRHLGRTAAEAYKTAESDMLKRNWARTCRALMAVDPAAGIAIKAAGVAAIELKDVAMSAASAYAMARAQGLDKVRTIATVLISAAERGQQKAAERATAAPVEVTRPASAPDPIAVITGLPAIGSYVVVTPRKGQPYTGIYEGQHGSGAVRVRMDDGSERRPGIHGAVFGQPEQRDYAPVIHCAPVDYSPRRQLSALQSAAKRIEAGIPGARVEIRKVDGKWQAEIRPTTRSRDEAMATALAAEVEYRARQSTAMTARHKEAADAEKKEQLDDLARGLGLDPDELTTEQTAELLELRANTDDALGALAEAVGVAIPGLEVIDNDQASALRRAAGDYRSAAAAADRADHHAGDAPENHSSDQNSEERIDGPSGPYAFGGISEVKNLLMAFGLDAQAVTVEAEQARARLESERLAAEASQIFEAEAVQAEAAETEASQASAQHLPTMSM